MKRGPKQKKKKKKMHWQVGRGQSVNLVTCDRTAEEWFFFLFVNVLNTLSERIKGGKKCSETLSALLLALSGGTTKHFG